MSEESTRKFTIHGQAVELVCKLDDGFIVQDVFESEDEQREYFGPHRYEALVFDTPPTAKYDEGIAKLKTSIEELTEKRDKIAGEIADFEHKNAERVKLFQRYQELQLLEDFIGGKITHYVENSYGRVKITKFFDAVSGEDRFERRLKLLTLFGDSDGGLAWRLNYYRDGSGSNTDVFPVTSEEAATAKAREVIVQLFEKTKDHPWESVIKSAQEFSVPVPPSYSAAFKERELKNEKKRLDDLHKATAESEKKIQALQATP